MVTAADGAVQHYNTWIGSESYAQSPGEARERDEQLRKVYSKHRDWHLIKNEADKSFIQKLEMVKETILTSVGGGH